MTNVFFIFLSERLFQTFWKTQGHWYLSRRTLKLTRRTLGHYPTIKDELQIWLKELKSSKPLSETFTDATYLDQTQTAHAFCWTFRSLYLCVFFSWSLPDLFDTNKSDKNYFPFFSCKYRINYVHVDIEKKSQICVSVLILIICSCVLISIRSLEKYLNSINSYRNQESCFAIKISEKRINHYHLCPWFCK